MTSLYVSGRNLTSLYVCLLFISFCTDTISVAQLFLEEERERELEALYETGIADSFNRTDVPIGSSTDDSVPATADIEVTGVFKQTIGTLMAGERIMEALELADGEIAAFLEYEIAKTQGGLLK